MSVFCDHVLSGEKSEANINVDKCQGEISFWNAAHSKSGYWTAVHNPLINPVFILKQNLKIKKWWIIKELSTETKYRPTGHSSKESDVLALITLELAQFLKGQKSEQKKNGTSISFQEVVKFILGQNYQYSFLVWRVFLNKISSTSYRILSTYFFCWCTKDTKTYIYDYGFHSSGFTMTLTFAFHCTIPAVPCVLLNYNIWTVDLTHLVWSTAWLDYRSEGWFYGVENFHTAEVKGQLVYSFKPRINLILSL